MIWDTIIQMPNAHLLAFITGGLVLNFAPGQDVFFASACGIQGGVRAGALAGLGVGLGVLLHVALATAGLGALVAAHPGAMTVIKYIGAGYLLFLAWKSWTAGPVDPQARGSVRTWNILRRGFLSNALNPKPVLFFLAFLPTFTNPDWGPVWQQVLSLGLIFALTGTLVTMGYGVVAGLAGQVIGPRLGLVNKIAAVMFAGLAIRLVAR
ncbi:LysE family translocator [Paracoccus sp. (in: a-proteobacteria)]|uniref:LysE family translocator n=1 Tax=Paracoccus sp. TaxID=267 RepID=UPI0026DFA744|nr:LysE family translocator [Paracoccus sp. (in: a-proteobacteria)]MDO5648634.1 LysE family translocator [Paracoccus sp. (in: a-proteobacteria)]